jgi:hypothetical protein
MLVAVDSLDLDDVMAVVRVRGKHDVCDRLGSGLRSVWNDLQCKALARDLASDGADMTTVTVAERLIPHEREVVRDVRMTEGWYVDDKLMLLHGLCEMDTIIENADFDVYYHLSGQR